MDPLLSHPDDDGAAGELATKPNDDVERTTADVSEADKLEFLHLVRQGFNRPEAAKMIGFKARHFRAICSPSSRFFDEDFKVRYDEAEGSFEHAEGRLERLRAEAQRRALIDSDRLLEKLLMVHDPDWQVLRQKDVHVNIEVVLRQAFKQLPTEKLEKVLELLENDEIVDAEFMSLTTGDAAPESQ